MSARDESHPPIPKTKAFLFSALLIVISVGVALMAAEVALRLKNSSMTNYDIEMWRYVSDYYPIDGHPTENGYKKVSACVAQAFKKLVTN